MEIKRALRSQAKIKLALTGPTGSGKTYSALRLAKGLGDKILFIDTENGSASLYADRFEFDVIELSPPYEVEKYTQAIDLAVKGKYDVIVIDSLSHAWAGEGGLLQKKEQLDARGGNSYTNWAKMTPVYEKFMATLLHCPINLVATMRSKMSYEIVDDNGKKKPVKIGLAPIMRDGAEYEFSTIFDVALNHEAQVTKDRTGLFTDKIFQITEETGKQIKTWLAGAKPVETTVAAPATPTKVTAPTSTLRNELSHENEAARSELKAILGALDKQTRDEYLQLLGNEVLGKGRALNSADMLTLDLIDVLACLTTVKSKLGIENE